MFAVEEEQSREEESEETAEQEQGEYEEMADEGLGMSSESEEDSMHSICRKHAVLTQEEQVEEEDSPALQDVLMSQRHLHLPGIEEAKALALLLLELADNSDLHLVPVDFRQKIATAASSLHEHDKTADRSHPRRSHHSSAQHELPSFMLKSQSQNQLLWTSPFDQSLPHPPTFSQSLLRPPTNPPLCRQHPYSWFFLHSHRLPPSYFMGHHAVRALYL
ncbi:hypothetical protein D5F01_LYC16251 [Larimichthys crocea]|uniref:Uncharacterized protein n=1 Tax=Larimichthys crocea TaxID=215358 RepID=A0A6G0I060_LARCR|nr:hypothetical protein D5F01_LYC16251 [Larimichthys crocea]